MSIAIVHRRAGFTLIELMVCVVVLGLLTGAAMLSFAAPIRVAERKLAIDLIRDADVTARNLARSFDRPVVLSFDLNRGTIAQPTSTIVLPGAVRMDEMRIAPSERRFDRATISYSASGLGRAYAVRLVVGDQEPTWLVFSGLSGQMMQVNDEATVDRLLSVRVR